MMNNKMKLKNASFNQTRGNYKKWIKWVFSCMIQSKFLFSLLVIIFILGFGIMSSYIFVSSYIYDRFLIYKTDYTELEKYFIMFGYLCMTIVLLGLANALFNYLINLITLSIFEKKVCFSLRRKIFKKIQNLTITYFDTTPTGELISRSSNDVDNISASAQFISDDVYLFSTIIGNAIMMFLINWLLALSTLWVYVLMIFSMLSLVKKIRKNFFIQQQHVGIVNSFIEERVSGVKNIILYNQENKSIEEFAKINQELTDKSLLANAGSTVLMPIGFFFVNFSFIPLTGIGITLLVTCPWISNYHHSVIYHYNELPALLIAFTLYCRHLAFPLNEIISTLGQVFLAFASFRRVFDLLDEKEEKDSINAKTLKDIKGVVVANNLCFSYTKDKSVLKNINFVARPNEVTAIVGPTGCGKTTLISLLDKFYTTNEGSLTIDNIPINEITNHSLRENVNIILQDNFLFNTTIRENIRFGRLDASDEQVEEAAKLSYANEFIEKLPDKYETIVTQNGLNLSQGQRQTIAIARALLSNAKIIIMDEATSSIDTKMEKDIQRSMKNLLKNRTAIIIAHRLSTIMDANNILVMSEGRIIESGNHDELMKRHGFYYQLFTSQQKKGMQI